MMNVEKAEFKRLELLLDIDLLELRNTIRKVREEIIEMAPPDYNAGEIAEEIAVDGSGTLIDSTDSKYLTKFGQIQELRKNAPELLRDDILLDFHFYAERGVYENATISIGLNEDQNRVEIDERQLKPFHYNMVRNVLSAYVEEK